jgi:hypothetical protein
MGDGIAPAPRRLPGRPREKALVPLDPAEAASCHPAYEAMYEAYGLTGGSYAAALAMVKEFWDEAQQGGLPDVRTVQRWGRDDHWDARLLQEIQERGDKQTALVNLGLQQLQLLAIRGARDILLEEGNPKFAVAKRGVFRDVMFLTGVGILGNRYGRIDTAAASEPAVNPDEDLSTEELIEQTADDYQQWRRRQA